MRKLILFFYLVIACVSCTQPRSESPEASARLRILINQEPIRFQDFVSLLPYIDVQPSPTIKDTAFISFQMENPEAFPQQLVLFLGFEQQVKLQGLDQAEVLGTMVPASQKPPQLNGIIFLRDEGFSNQLLIALEPGESRQIELEISRFIPKSYPVDLKLLHPAYWETRTPPFMRHFWQGIFQGMVWALILYHLLLFFMVRDITYFHYCAYMLCVSLLTLGDFGYWQTYLFAEKPYIGWWIFQFLQYFTGIMTFVFMQSFVRLNTLLPRLNIAVNRFLFANLIYLLMIIVLWAINRDHRIIDVTKFLMIPFAGFGLYVCYKLIRSGNIVALYFAIAGGVFSLAVAVNAGVEVFGQMDYMYETPYARYNILQVGAILHLLTFSLGMGYRRRQKDLATQRTLELDRVKTRLYTNITHEFRTPLTVIMGMSENITGHQKEKSLIRRNSKHLLRLINQLLDLSKLESGNLKLQMIQSDLVSYLQYLTESFHSMAIEKGVRLTFYSEEEELVMDFDEVKIQHIIYNLLSNAIKFTGTHGKVILHLKKEKLHGQDMLQLKIKDTGSGIAPEHLPHIFDRFYQVDSSSTRRGEGTGIGLSLTKELVQLMEGEIDVSSTLDKGTTFIIHLPISQEAQIVGTKEKIDLYEKKEKLLPTPLNLTEQTEVEGPVLLLIEDNPDVVIYIQSLLEKEYLIHTANNGQAGIDQACELIPDVIISDVMMPEKNGYEVCQFLKQDERTSHIPIILLTAKAAQEDKVKGLQFGADAFLTKPFDKEELFIRLSKLVELRQQLQKRFAHPDATDAGAESTASQHPLEDAFLQKLRQAVNSQIDNSDFGVNELAKTMTMSQTQVYRKLKALTNRTPSQFIRSIRLQKGQELLTTTTLTIAEIAYDVGFTDPNYFSRTFQQEFGSSPSDFRK